MMKLVLEWLKDHGGVTALELQNETKAALIYDAIDTSSFYLGTAEVIYRSTMNVTFNLAENDLLDKFLSQAHAQGLYALKGHRNVGGVRASIYNAMPAAGCQALVNFMKEFEKNHA